jgi:hypothetical protein
MGAVRRLGDDAVELFHLRGPANDVAETLLGFHFFAQDAVWGIGRAAYFDVNGISGRSLADKYYSANQCWDIDIE